MRPSVIVLNGCLALGCGLGSFAYGEAAEPVPPNDATTVTAQANAAVLNQLPFVNREDFEDAQRGFIAPLPDGIIKNDAGRPVWDLTAYGFLDKPAAAATVNPALYRQAQLNNINGLFKVTERIYQIRGFDISNMTIVEGDTGVIVIDPLISVETAKAGLDLYRKHRGPRPVKAVIYTHSHIDHWGGVKGVVNADEVKAGTVAILAPEGFLEAAISENVFVGNAMARRAIYMYGSLLPKGEKGEVDAGLGKTVSLGLKTLIAPTDVITNTGEKRVIDGVEIVFQMAPNTEAPAEMLFYFPQFKALCAAEDMTHTLHNLYTIRGAEVRNARAWWKTVQLSLDLYGDKTDVVFASHHWPKWNQEKVRAFFENQRDLYKYILDQSLRLMNHGYTRDEVAEMLVLPDSLSQEWYNRSFYGTVNTDAKAVYQKYLGWYDGNPAHLNPLPPEDAAKKYVEYMTGADAVIAKARDDYARGEYRWVAEVMSHVVFADPDNAEARKLEADALEQLGYQAESGPWRNAYLVGAFELRNGVPQPAAAVVVNGGIITAAPLDFYFDYLGIRMNGPKAAGKKAVINWDFTDTGEKYVLNLSNSALTYAAGRQAPNADVTITLTRAVLDEVTLGRTTFKKAVMGGKVRFDGDIAKLSELMGLLDDFDPMFNIVTP